MRATIALLALGWVLLASTAAAQYDNATTQPNTDGTSATGVPAAEGLPVIPVVLILVVIAVIVVVVLVLAPPPVEPPPP
ncbi:MAG: hypothetical protein LC624_09575 [Halobacteriales archaeon]|nr:hypothetical protein [Halobacteriales archaeon]